jgi:hypothetical protein
MMSFRKLPVPNKARKTELRKPERKNRKKRTKRTQR